jgi:hypothetical protein
VTLRDLEHAVGLSHVLPRFAGRDHSDRGGIDAVLPSKHRLGTARGGYLQYAPDFCHIFFGQFRVAYETAAKIAVAVAALVVHVPHIVAVSANEQVRWIHALWLIARVANFHSSGDGSVEQTPHESVRQEVSDPAVTRFNTTTWPRNALVVSCIHGINFTTQI